MKATVVSVDLLSEGVGVAAAFPRGLIRGDGAWGETDRAAPGAWCWNEPPAAEGGAGEPMPSLEPPAILRFAADWG